MADLRVARLAEDVGCDVGLDENRLRAAFGCETRDRGSETPGGAVAEVADRIDGLACAARAHGESQAQQIARPARFTHGRKHGGDDVARLAQAPDARIRARQAPGGRADEAHAALAQNGDVFLRGGVEPHLRVHRRSDEDRARRGQHDARQHVVGDSRANLRESVGRGRNDHDRIGLSGKPHVGDVGCVLADVGVDPAPGQRLPRDGADKVKGGAGGDDGDAVPRLLEQTNGGARLVRRDAAGDADDDRKKALLSEGPSSGQSFSVVHSTLSSRISSRAMDRGLSSGLASTRGPKVVMLPSPRVIS